MLPKKTAVIGIGNILRRDDGIGVVVLESLLKFYKREGIDYFNFGTAGLDLIHKMQDYNTVLLIDGVDAGWPFGKLRISKLCNIEYNLKDSATSTHEFNLKEIFEVSKKFRFKTKVYVAGIQVEDISYAEGLSFSLSSKKKDIVEEISAFIDKVICFSH